MNKFWLTLILVIVLLIAGIFAIRLFSGEDDWIKNKTGEYIKHGVPSDIPDYVKEQQDAVSCALQLYQQKKQEEMQFSSQCLGTCQDYAVDIVNVPKTSEDNLAENQCSDFREGKAKHFIELDRNGNIVRIA